MKDSWRNAHEQIEGYVAQARAWAEAGEPRRAEQLLPEVLSGSFGIHHDKDTQLGHWVDWFRRILNNLPELARPDIARFAAGVGDAAAARRGYESTQAAMDFLSAVARFDPAVGEQLRHSFLTETALEFLPGVESLCLAALRDADADPAIALATVRRICLPYQERSSVELAKALAARLLTLEDGAKARRFFREILAAIEADCAGAERRRWWHAFVEVKVRVAGASRFRQRLS
jgi:hypothetical protein